MLSREERVEKFGLDCVSELIWTEWEAGGEFVQDLIIKNVSLEVKKFKYKLPVDKSFMMPYPDPIVLAPGTVKTIPVRFEPLANEPILDFIEVVMPRTDAIGGRPGQANSGEGVRMFQVMLRWLQFLIHFSKVHVRIQPVAHF